MKTMQMNNSKKVLALAAVLIMCAASLVTVAYAYTATYKDTIAEKPLDQEYILVTGDNLEFPRSVIAVNFNTETEYNNGQNATVFKDVSISGNGVDADGSFDFIIGTVKVTNHSVNGKTIYYDCNIVNQKLSKTYANVLKNNAYSAYFADENGNKVPSEYYEGITDGEYDSKQITIHITGILDASKIGYESAIPGFKFTFLADASPIVPVDVKKDEEVTVAGTNSIASFISGDTDTVIVTSVVAEEAHKTYPTYTADQFIGGISVTDANVKKDTSVSIVFNNVSQTLKDQFDVYHYDDNHSDNIVDNGKVVDNYSDDVVVKYYDNTKTLTVISKLGFSSYVAFVDAEVKLDFGTGLAYCSLADALLDETHAEKRITVLKDVTIDGDNVLWCVGNITLDLNGHVVSVKGLSLYNNTLSVDNGTINTTIRVYGMESGKDGSTVFTLGSNATLNMPGDWAVAIFPYEYTPNKKSGSAHDAVVNIFGTVNGYVGNNGMILNASESGHEPQINITGATINGCLYVPGLTKVTARDSTFNIDNESNEVKGGSLDFQGCTFNAKYSTVTPVFVSASNGSWANNAVFSIDHAKDGYASTCTYTFLNNTYRITGPIVADVLIYTHDGSQVDVTKDNTTTFSYGPDGTLPTITAKVTHKSSNMDLRIYFADAYARSGYTEAQFRAEYDLDNSYVITNWTGASNEN